MPITTSSEGMTTSSVTYSEGNSKSSQSSDTDLIDTTLSERRSASDTETNWYETETKNIMYVFC